MVQSTMFEGEIKTARNTTFRPPTADEVAEYCRERQNSIDADAFVDFYASKGWMVGRNKMVDWQAAVRTWERKNGNFKGKHGSSNGLSRWIESNSSSVAK